MTEKSGKLPFPLKEAKDQNPRTFIIFGKPKTGKTTIASQLENSLLIELEPRGAEFISGSVVEVNSLQELSEVGNKIKEFGKPYRYIILDTVTALEELVLPLAAKLYKDTP